MAANYKVLQWNLREEDMSEEFMKSYKIDTLRIVPGDVKQELVKPEQGRKGIAKAEKAYNIMMASNSREEKISGKSKASKDTTGGVVDEAVNTATRIAEDHDAEMAKYAAEDSGNLTPPPSTGPSLVPFNTKCEYTETINRALPKAVPYPDKQVILKDTNLYEALKYVRPGYFLIPSTALPSKFDKLPDGRITSFDIYPVKQAKLTIVNIARFPFAHDHPLEHLRGRFDTIWTHFLKSIHVVAQLSWRPKAKPQGYTFEWIWDNCVHLRPEVMQRALPATSRLALGPLTNGNEITWLVAPRSNPTNYIKRWHTRQHEQEKLLKEGKSMLPKEERRKLKREMKEQMKLVKEKGGHAIEFSPMSMAVARLGINRRIDTILFKYEKLYAKIRTYVGSRYGRNRFMNREERDTVHAVMEMEKVEYLKHNQAVYLPPRNQINKYQKEESKEWKRETGSRDYMWREDPGQGKQNQARKGYDAPMRDGKSDLVANIEVLKIGAQENWDEDEPMNLLSDHKLARPQFGHDTSKPSLGSAPIRYEPCDLPSDADKETDKEDLSKRFGLLRTIRKHEVASWDQNDKHRSPRAYDGKPTSFESNKKPDERSGPNRKERRVELQRQDSGLDFTPRDDRPDYKLMGGLSGRVSRDGGSRYKPRDGQPSYQSRIGQSSYQSRDRQSNYQSRDSRQNYPSRYDQSSFKARDNQSSSKARDGQTSFKARDSQPSYKPRDEKLSHKSRESESSSKARDDQSSSQPRNERSSYQPRDDQSSHKLSAKKPIIPVLRSQVTVKT
jgi:hypothetical protein